MEAIQKTILVIVLMYTWSVWKTNYSNVSMQGIVTTSLATSLHEAERLNLIASLAWQPAFDAH